MDAMDIEMDDAYDVGHGNAVDDIPEAYTQDIITGEEQEPGEIDEPANDGDHLNSGDKAVVPNKIFVRGIDTFNPDDVKAYLKEHYSGGQFEYIQWVNDTSANLVFGSESAAQEALIALSAVEIADPTQLLPLENLPAKGYGPKPECTLQVRFSVASDKKTVGAASQSRFYLLNPEYDPEERRRRGENRRYRDRNGDGNGKDRRRRRYSDDDDETPFDVNLYDDDEEALAKRSNQLSNQPRRSRRDRSPSYDNSDQETFRDRNKDKELFPDRRSRNALSSRNRSASPRRDRDGDESMDSGGRNGADSRSAARPIKDRLSSDNRGKELFPAKVNDQNNELFPTKITSDSISKAQMDQVDEKSVLASAKLADRISSRTAADTSSFNIRGMANKRGSDQGFAIKGAGASAKELFPDRFNNAGKELFADKLEGRGRRRQKAEDMFH